MAPFTDQEHRIIFSHSRVNETIKGVMTGANLLYSSQGRLVVPTGPNSIEWSYGTNTVTYPTYGGEVVQILSTFIEDITFTGTLANYRMMEDLYLWFLVYMNIATQGVGNASYVQEPVEVWYPMREWYFKVKIKELPGYRVGTDVVAPEWGITAAVVESNDEANLVTLQGAVEGLEKIKPGIGYLEPNPFSSPTVNVNSFGSVDEGLDAAANVYIDIMKQFSDNNFDAVTNPYMSGPLKPTTPSAEQEKEK